jgi:hypothetical protein
MLEHYSLRIHRQLLYVRGCNISDCVAVLSPPELRAMVVSDLRDALANYGQ